MTVLLLRLTVLTAVVSLCGASEASAVNDEALRFAQSGNLREALGLFQRAVSLDPSVPDHYNNLAVTQLRLGLYHSATANVARALALDPTHRAALDNRALMPQYLPHIGPWSAVPSRVATHVREPIPRVHVSRWMDPSSSSFRSGSRPFILVGAMDGWPALGKWTPGFFAKAYGADLAEHYSQSMYRESVKPRFVSIADALRDAGASSDAAFRDKPGTYTQWNLMMPTWRALMDDFGTMPALFTSDDEWMERCFLSHSDALADKFLRGTHWRMVLIGTPLSGMFNHKDILRTSSWQAQVAGAKRWHLCSGAEDSRLYHAGDVDAFSPDYERFPLARDAVCMEDVLKTGEMLYYPEDWWHQTEVLGEGANPSEEDWSVSLTGTLVTPSNHRLVAAELRYECDPANAKKRRLPLDPELCDALPRCFEVWDEMYSGGVTTRGADEL